MHNFHVSENLNETLKRLSKKNRVLHEQILKKIEEIINSLDIEHYKNVKNHQSKTGGMIMPHFVWFLSMLRIPRVIQTTRHRRVEF